MHLERVIVMYLQNSPTHLNLFHYTNFNLPTLILDPLKFANNSFTKRDKALSGVPRAFFYLDPREKESFFQSPTLYTTCVPRSSIYNIALDPVGIKAKVFEKRPDFDVLLKEIVKAGYKGAYYNPGFKVVCWFEPIEVRKTPEGLGTLFL